MVYPVQALAAEGLGLAGDARLISVTRYRFLDGMGDVGVRDFADHAAALAWARDDVERDDEVQRVEFLGPGGDWRWAGPLLGLIDAAGQTPQASSCTDRSNWSRRRRIPCGTRAGVRRGRLLRSQTRVAFGFGLRDTSDQGSEGVQGVDELAGEAASAMAGVIQDDEPAVRPGTVQLPGSVQRPGDVVAAMDQHGGDAG